MGLSGVVSVYGGGMTTEGRSGEFEELREYAVHVARSKRREKDPTEAEDIAQEVMLSLSRLESWPDNPRAWVRRAVENEIIDDWRRGRARPEEVPETGYSTENDTFAWLARNVPTSASGMQTIAYTWFRQRLGTVFTDDEIQLLSMVGIRVPHAEIASVLGYKNAAVVKTTLARLRKKADALDRAELEQLLHHPRAY